MKSLKIAGLMFTLFTYFGWPRALYISSKLLKSLQFVFMLFMLLGVIVEPANLPGYEPDIEPANQHVPDITHPLTVQILGGTVQRWGADGQAATACSLDVWTCGAYVGRWPWRPSALGSTRTRSCTRNCPVCGLVFVVNTNPDRLIWEVSHLYNVAHFVSRFEGAGANWLEQLD